MSAKKSTIATAEKRVIKAEIATHKKAWNKVFKDCSTARRKLFAEKLKIDRELKRIDKAQERERLTICRRIAILQGRL
jgi:hypothetical protein